MIGFGNTRTRRNTSAAEQARARCAARAHNEPADEPDAPGTGGWFDSSHALLEGLTVVEHEDLQGGTLDRAMALWVQ